jgi:hypothetical protein
VQNPAKINQNNHEFLRLTYKTATLTTFYLESI